MNAESVELLKKSTGSVVTLISCTGETILAKILAVDEHTSEELVYQPISLTGSDTVAATDSVRVDPLSNILAVSYVCPAPARSKRRPQSRWHGTRRHRLS